MVAGNRSRALVSFEYNCDCKGVPPSWPLDAIIIVEPNLNRSKPKSNCLDSSSLLYVANASIFRSPLDANRNCSVPESFVEKSAIEKIAIVKRLSLEPNA